ncbi:hypothetical protein P879_06261 [Paragonimus westermani]|uniref:GT23 domain-containing protein n=1 Tax=Paragonimus westermani TaxID=34504 RepID=A0A8T0DP16_9TREM|nr:hypothetical protein P879_06261 [Paragonimus westermani]
MTRHLQVDLEGLGRVNGMAESRRSELDQLARRVWYRIDKLQNPSDCSKAKFLVVGLTRPCAFGCNVHHLAYCFQMAYVSGRTLVFDNVKTAYDSWWKANFLPLSKTCNQLNITDSEHIPLFDGSNATSTIRVTLCDYIGSMSNSVKSLPPAIPRDLASDLERLHEVPFIWFIGHLTAYLMRPTVAFEQLLNSTLEAYKLVGVNRNPVVGVHVRRTDKINYEAAFYPLHEYINHVERRFKFWQSQRQLLSKNDEWIGETYTQQQVQSITRRVFIATDDPSVFEEAKKYYPQYQVEGDPEHARSAAVSRRSQTDSITGIALDILVLSRTDYLVCTFSSQVCRLAYELMQTRHAELGDASGLAWSLDSIYYFGGQQSNPYKTFIADEATGAKPGDLFHMDGNRWNGYADLHSIPNNTKVTLPAYKVCPRVLTVELTETGPV